MIDLSFLTDEEQETIRDVLKRDAKLKKIEEHRVQTLLRTVGDHGQLRFLTGDWFYQTKQNRHPDRIHGCDIIRASMKHVETMMERCYGGPEDVSLTSDEDAPHPLGEAEWKEKQNHSEINYSTLKRKNPFNVEEDQSVSDQLDAEEETKASCENSVSGNLHVSQVTDENQLTHNNLLLMPENKVPDRNSTGSSVNMEHRPVLPRSPLGAFQDLLVKSKVDYENKKQVRFCGSPGLNGAEWMEGKELGEHGLLDSDVSSEEQTDVGSTTYQPCLKRNRLDSLKKENNGANFYRQQSKQASHVGDKPSTFLSEEEVLGAAAPSEQKNQVQEPKDESSLASDEDTSNNEDEIRPRHGPIQFGMLNSEELVKTPFSSLNSLVGKSADTQILNHSTREVKAEPTMGNPPSEELKTSLDPCTRPDPPVTPNLQCRDVKITDTENISSEGTFVKTLTKFSLNPENKFEVTVLPQLDETMEGSGSSFQRDHCLLVDLSNNDGTYRASPVLISDDCPPDTHTTHTHNPMSTQDVTETRVLLSTSASQQTTPPKLKNTEPPKPKVTQVSEGSLSDQKNLNGEPASPQRINPGEGRSGEATEKNPEGENSHNKQQPQSWSQETPLSRNKTPQYRPMKDHDDVRRSPSKTCHPKVLPRDSSGDTQSRVPGSPLKTFPIDINPKTHFTDQPKDKPTSWNSTSSKTSQQSGTITGVGNASPHPKNTRGSGVQKENTGDSGVQRISRDFCNYIPFRNSPRVVPSFLREKEDSFSRTQSLSRNSGETRNPKDEREQMVLSNDNVNSMFPCYSHVTMKTSVSVPILLQQDETDSDNAGETPMGYRRNTSSSASNLSLSSVGGGSVSSLSGADLVEVEVQGSVQLAVNYIQKLGELQVFVVLCRGLAMSDRTRSCSDPYVKCYLLPDQTKLGKRKTSVKRKTLNPTYNEILRFKVRMDLLKTQSLNVSVWNNETFGRNHFLGQVDLDMSEWDFSNTTIHDYTLKDRPQVLALTPPVVLEDNRGHMRLALRFLPQTSHSKRTANVDSGEVQIWIKDCKNLSPTRGVLIDPFVKWKSRQKTRVVKRTANPMFNHTMVYDGFRTEDLKEACVEITVWDHDRLHNHYIGGLRLGLGTGRSYGADVPWMDSSAPEACLWGRMLQSDSEWVEDVLPLRMLVLAKGLLQ